MKKILGLGVLALGVITLASCSSNGERVETKDLYGVNDLGLFSKIGTQDVLFKKDSKVPYVELKECSDLLSKTRSAGLEKENAKVSLNKDGNNYVLQNELGAKCTLSIEAQTISYDDYDKFTAFLPDGQNPLAITLIKPSKKSIKTVSSDYTKGKELVIDLKPYTKLDIYERGGKCYLPLSVFNTTFYSVNTTLNLAYNGKAFFMIAPNQLTQNNFLGIAELTALGEKFFEGAQINQMTEEYALYNYQSLCYDFNNFYGLREKFSSFEDYLAKKGYETQLQSTDPKKVDETTGVALSYLMDGHTALTEFSYMYEYGTSTLKANMLNPEKNAWHDGDEKLAMAKVEAKVQNGIEYYNDNSTVFISFAEFTALNEDLLYGTGKELDITDLLSANTFGITDDEDEKESIEEMKLKDTAYLFNKLYKDLTSDLYKWTIKNIVVDLSTNDGGAAESLIYALSTLLGDVSMDITNPITGARNHQVYKADINADGVIDSKDKSLSELGFNIYFLNSKYSFSSANAMPVIAKLNSNKVITLGDKTAGGPCAVRYTVTPMGSAYNSSSLTVISKLVDGKYVNIDDGVAADFKLTEEQMINRKYIAENISKWVINN